MKQELHVGRSNLCIYKLGEFVFAIFGKLHFRSHMCVGE